MGFEANADPKPPRPNPPISGVVVVDEDDPDTGASFLGSTFSSGLPNGFVEVVGFEPNALCPNPLDDPNALPDPAPALTAPPDPNGLSEEPSVGFGLGWPNADCTNPDPDPDFAAAPNPANPPVEGTEPNADDVEIAGWPKADGLDGCPNAVCPNADG